MSHVQQRYFYSNTKTRQQNLESCTQILNKMIQDGKDENEIRALLRNKLVVMGFRSPTVNSYLEALGLL